MPKDAEYGRALAEQLTAVYSGRIKKVRFTYDAFVELDRISEGDPYCAISPNGYEEIRESRNHWRETTQLVLTLVSPVGPTDDETWVDQWLDSWDLIVASLREMEVFSRRKPTEVTRMFRYDADMFHNNRRLLTQAMITYANVSLR